MSNQRLSEAARSTATDVVLRELREADRDRFLQVLLAPSAQRKALLALFQFNVELARIADQVREPMAGLIRLQWWRDALAKLAQDPEASHEHPVLVLLAETRLVERLDGAAIEALVDARERELDATPLRNVEAVEDHARATAGHLNHLVGRLLGGQPAALDHAEAAGTAYGLLGIARAVPFVLGRSQPLLPQDRLEAAQVTADELWTRRDAAALSPVLAAVVAAARDRLATVPRYQPRAVAAAFVPAILARQDLERLRSFDYDVFDARLVDRPPWTLARCLVAKGLCRF